jgi:hypothetical protein
MTIEVLSDHRVELEHQRVRNRFDCHKSNYNPRTQLS